MCGHTYEAYCTTLASPSIRRRLIQGCAYGIYTFGIEIYKNTSIFQIFPTLQTALHDRDREFPYFKF